MHENNTFKVSNRGTLTYEARQNTDFSCHICVDQAENTLETLQRLLEIMCQSRMHTSWNPIQKEQTPAQRKRCGTEYTGICILFRILAAFHSIKQPHNTTLSQEQNTSSSVKMYMSLCAHYLKCSATTAFTSSTWKRTDLPY